MRVDWDLFFGPGQRVIALPNWTSPRLLLDASSLRRRWELSRLFPASRIGAKVLKAYFRMRHSVLPGVAKQSRTEEWGLGPALGCIPGAYTSALLVGRMGPVQKLVARVETDLGAHFLKYPVAKSAERLVENEWNILTHLPKDLGPRAVRFTSLNNRQALLTQEVTGPGLPTRIEPPRVLASFLSEFALPDATNFAEHPKVVQLCKRGEPALVRWLEILDGRSWAVMIEHGDLAPWNLRSENDGKIRAIDWEYGSYVGFPGLDAACYVLQLACLVGRRPPEWGAAQAAKYVGCVLGPEVSESEARAIVSLAAFNSYCISLDLGYDRNDPVQAWRRAIWEGGR